MMRIPVLAVVLVGVVMADEMGLLREIMTTQKKMSMKLEELDGKVKDVTERLDAMQESSAVNNRTLRPKERGSSSRSTAGRPNYGSHYYGTGSDTMMERFGSGGQKSTKITMMGKEVKEDDPMYQQMMTALGGSGGMLSNLFSQGSMAGTKLSITDGDGKKVSKDDPMYRKMMAAMTGGGDENSMMDLINMAMKKEEGKSQSTKSSSSDDLWMFG